MPIRIVKQPLFFSRKGVRMNPPVGQPFDFTNDELNSIMALNPAAVDFLLTVDAEVKEVIAPEVEQPVVSAPVVTNKVLAK